MMEVIDNIGQSLNFNKSYIITTNYILLFDNYLDYKIRLEEITTLPEYGQIGGYSLYYDINNNIFYFN